MNLIFAKTNRPCPKPIPALKDSGARQRIGVAIVCSRTDGTRTQAGDDGAGSQASPLLFYRPQRRLHSACSRCAVTGPRGRGPQSTPGIAGIVQRKLTA
jgi:hypothetical protein